LHERSFGKSPAAPLLHQVKLSDPAKTRIDELGLEDAWVNSAGGLDRSELVPALAICPDGIRRTYRSVEDGDEILRTCLGAPVAFRD